MGTSSLGIDIQAFPVTRTRTLARVINCARHPRAINYAPVRSAMLALAGIRGTWL